jgi:hypothetical protein
MKLKLICLFSLLLFATSCSSASSSNNENPQPEKKDTIAIPQFCGSFLQPWLSSNWTDKRWDEEMSMLKNAGIQYLIYGPALNVNTKEEVSACYPTSLASSSNQNRSLEGCLKSAKKYGLKILIGINFHDSWWNSSMSEEWLVKQMETGNKVADELVALYKTKYDDTMYGWYWVWEVDNVNWKTKARRTALINALNTNLDHLTSITPNMPLWLSPFMNENAGGGLNPEGYSLFWQEIFTNSHFRKGDIFVPQDCIGAGGVQLYNIVSWFSMMKQAVAVKPGLKFWGNVETFNTYSASAPLSRVVEQLKKEQPYVENFICFAYSHYNSPLIVHESYNTAYNYYRTNGSLPKLSTPSPVVAATASKESDGVKILWISGDLTNAAGYNIYRDGKLIAMVQYKNGSYPTQYIDTSAGSTIGTYEISVYNVLGEESIKVKVQQ